MCERFGVGEGEDDEVKMKVVLVEEGTGLMKGRGGK